MILALFLILASVVTGLVIIHATRPRPGPPPDDVPYDVDMDGTDLGLWDREVQE